MPAYASQTPHCFPHRVLIFGIIDADMEVLIMAYGYPYNVQNGPVPSYFNTNYIPPQMQMPQQTQQPAQHTNISWVYVNGVQGARDQIVQPGQTVWMMDNNDPVIHVKAVDGMGTATLKSFQLLELNPQQQAAAAQPDLSQYATRAEVQNLADRLQKFEAELGGLNT